MALKRILSIGMILLMFSFHTIEEKWVSGTVISAEDGKPLPGVNVILKGTSNGTVTDINGYYRLKIPDTGGVLVFSFIGMKTLELKTGSSSLINAKLDSDVKQLSEVVRTGRVRLGKGKRSKAEMSAAPVAADAVAGYGYMYDREVIEVHNTEEYDGIEENIFHTPANKPLSTFSIDVDAASYSNVRRFLNNGQMPPKDAVRIEEMINYFDYDYAQPTDEHPFAVHTEISTAPWNTQHQLVHIGLQGKEMPLDELPASNLVLLLDVSGSMNAPNKLPLLKSAFKMLVENLREEDRVAMVVYAGAAGVVLNSTSGAEKSTIHSALNRLSAGGSTAGGAGIQLAYKIAKENFIEGGNNRVILATDGDFNIGASSNGEMQRLIEEKRKGGVFLTVLGFGMGNYKDSKMETLANKGNGNYAYIDTITEAKKVLVNEFGGTLFTIAKDVKLQIEFNPTKVQAYRLIGYENRALKAEDFNNDKKDAGELGSGHTVTALYEIIPVGVDSDFSPVDGLRYQKTEIVKQNAKSKELMNIKLRYKQPDEGISNLIEKPVIDQDIKWKDTSNNFKWSAAVASFGMLLRDSQFKGDATFSDIIQWAKVSKGRDMEGYRSEFIRLVESSSLMASAK